MSWCCHVTSAPAIRTLATQPAMPIELDRFPGEKYGFMRIPRPARRGCTAVGADYRTRGLRSCPESYSSRLHLGVTTRTAGAATADRAVTCAASANAAIGGTIRVYGGMIECIVIRKVAHAIISPAAHTP